MRAWEVCTLADVDSVTAELTQLLMCVHVCEVCTLADVDTVIAELTQLLMCVRGKYVL